MKNKSFMFDEVTGFYYDLQISEDGSKKKLLENRGKDPEGWLPLWAKLATKDHALYGVEALQNYGHCDEAKICAYKLFDNAEGLLADGSIRENYNPMTGAGLHTKNFSGSAAAYYLLYQNALTGNKTTYQSAF